ncbi:hypothetical protein AXF42_Ash015267 [Apostasia shenzhenica]|uniref:Uncharacterized protein n=1 Tax=Apostasia shenzhenica TaxID=1088818 RepID=A0A2I0ALS7_9ASPA|nr:hypothetical protein AXF42_Ash015267 [Apostasia shenzhenica]
MARVQRRRWEQASSGPSTRYFSQTSLNGAEKHHENLSPIYGISNRYVPQGPNPLHN